MAAVEERPPRARAVEARRNRDNLVAAATRAFASGCGPVSLEAVARDAGVGIGTLYRHFPKREALVEAVYEDQVDRLSWTARDLLTGHPPAEAFRRWTAVFVDWAATKHGMIDTLRTLMSSGQLEAGQMRTELIGIVASFLDAGRATGDLRSDVSAADVAATLAGILVVAGAPEQRDQATRMAELVLDGLRPDPARGRRAPGPSAASRT